MLGLDGRALVDEFKRQYRDPSDVDLDGAAALAPRGTAPASDHARERGDRGRVRGGGDRGRAAAAAEAGGRRREAPGRPPRSSCS